MKGAHVEPEDLDQHRAWSCLVEAEREVARCRADIYRSPERTELLRAALTGSIGDQSTALAFLREFPDDVPALLPLLYHLSLSPRWLVSALQAIRSAAAKDASVTNALREIIQTEMLEAAEEDEYRAVVNVLVRIDATDLLIKLGTQALGSDDPAVRQVGAELEEDYGAQEPDAGLD